MTTYKDAGVDISAGNKSVDLIKPIVKETFRPEVMCGLGGFGSLFNLDLSKYHNPVLVSGTDGVGTKLKLAFQSNKHDTIGQDVVAMCVNDILVQGAEPLFFLDYLAVGKLIPEQVTEIVKGIADGCKLAGCSLIGGETAEMPGFYSEGEYDVAGFAVGIVNKENIIDGSKIKENDILIGLPSSGVHSNGFSLIRKILQDLKSEFTYLNEPLIDMLLKPTKIYVKSILPILKTNMITGMVHVTGGGFTENIPRILPEGLGVKINTKAYRIPYVFEFIQRYGDVSFEEMYQTFNMGIGFILIVDQNNVSYINEKLKELGEKPIIIGKVTNKSGVQYL